MNSFWNFLIENHWASVFMVFSVTLVCVVAVIGQIKTRKLGEQLTESSIEVDHLNDEVYYLIRIHRLVEPVVVDVETLRGITSDRMIEMGTTTSSDSDKEIEAALRVHEEYVVLCDNHGQKASLYLSPKALKKSGVMLRDSIVNQKGYLAAIDGTLAKKTA